MSLLNSVSDPSIAAITWRNTMGLSPVTPSSRNSAFKNYGVKPQLTNYIIKSHTVAGEQGQIINGTPADNNWQAWQLDPYINDPLNPQLLTKEYEWNGLQVNIMGGTSDAVGSSYISAGGDPLVITVAQKQGTPRGIDENQRIYEDRLYQDYPFTSKIQSAAYAAMAVEQQNGVFSVPTESKKLDELIDLIKKNQLPKSRDVSNQTDARLNNEMMRDYISTFENMPHTTVTRNNLQALDAITQYSQAQSIDSRYGNSDSSLIDLYLPEDEDYFDVNSDTASQVSAAFSNMSRRTNSTLNRAREMYPAIVLRESTTIVPDTNRRVPTPPIIRIEEDPLQIQENAAPRPVNQQINPSDIGPVRTPQIDIQSTPNTVKSTVQKQTKEYVPPQHTTLKIDAMNIPSPLGEIRNPKYSEQILPRDDPPNLNDSQIVVRAPNTIIHPNTVTTTLNNQSVQKKFQLDRQLVNFYHLHRNHIADVLRNHSYEIPYIYELDMPNVQLNRLPHEQRSHNSTAMPLSSDETLSLQAQLAKRIYEYEYGDDANAEIRQRVGMKKPPYPTDTPEQIMVGNLKEQDNTQKIEEIHDLYNRLEHGKHNNIFDSDLHAASLYYVLQKRKENKTRIEQMAEKLEQVIADEEKRLAIQKDLDKHVEDTYAFIKQNTKNLETIRDDMNEIIKDTNKYIHDYHEILKERKIYVDYVKNNPLVNKKFQDVYSKVMPEGKTAPAHLPDFVKQIQNYDNKYLMDAYNQYFEKLKNLQLNFDPNRNTLKYDTYIRQCTAASNDLYNKFSTFKNQRIKDITVLKETVFFILDNQGRVGKLSTNNTITDESLVAPGRVLENDPNRMDWEINPSRLPMAQGNTQLDNIPGFQKLAQMKTKSPYPTNNYVDAVGNYDINHNPLEVSSEDITDNRSSMNVLNSQITDAFNNSESLYEKTISNDQSQYNKYTDPEAEERRVATYKKVEMIAAKATKKIDDAYQNAATNLLYPIKVSGSNAITTLLPDASNILRVEEDISYNERNELTALSQMPMPVSHGEVDEADFMDYEMHSIPESTRKRPRDDDIGHLKSSLYYANMRRIKTQVFGNALGTTSSKYDPTGQYYPILEDYVNELTRISPNSVDDKSLPQLQYQVSSLISATRGKSYDTNDQDRKDDLARITLLHMYNIEQIYERHNKRMTKEERANLLDAQAFYSAKVSKVLNFKLGS